MLTSGDPEAEVQAPSQMAIPTEICLKAAARTRDLGQPLKHSAPNGREKLGSRHLPNQLATLLSPSQSVMPQTLNILPGIEKN